MNDGPYAFKVGDRVVTTWLGPDQPEGVVTAINVLRTDPLLYTVSVVFGSGEELEFGPLYLCPASEKAGLPVPHWPPDPLRLATRPPRSPLLAPDWEADDISEAALAEAVNDWERSVGYVESGYDYREDTDEYDYDLFNRECVHALLIGFERLNQPVPEALANRIARADHRFVELTVEQDFKSALDYDRTAFWYYFRWPRKL